MLIKETIIVESKSTALYCHVAVCLSISFLLNQCVISIIKRYVYSWYKNPICCAWFEQHNLPSLTVHRPFTV